MPILMRRETPKSITRKEITDDYIYTTIIRKESGHKTTSMESLYKYSYNPRGYARLLELRDYKYEREVNE